ncbi:hypothetical protein K1719_009086 [Acacia pycnantha]|nr:hypothetical protein K1719_009086 [Acacia pycnantha]
MRKKPHPWLINTWNHHSSRSFHFPPSIPLELSLLFYIYPKSFPSPIASFPLSAFTIHNFLSNTSRLDPLLSIHLSNSRFSAW